uniref:C2H2-type domain-containing protein n=1 Tax=Parascaris univalens TaxID=6257 RepID=A0A915BFY7_PARUN
MDRPIVVNSLLCFIHNYRESVLPHELSALVNNYFPKSVISVAHATLVELLPPHLAANPPSDILFLFDRICRSEQSPVFAAADLTILPLRLITDEDDSKNELLREIRQLKRFIQDALNGRLEEPTPNSNSRTPPTEEHNFSTPKLSCKQQPHQQQSNISASSPESPASVALFNGPCSSALALTATSSGDVQCTPTLPYSRPNHCSDTSSNTHNSNKGNTSCCNMNKNNHSIKKRAHGCGDRLDATVRKLRKLADKQNERETFESSAHGVWPTQMVDPVAYMNMLRTMTITASVASHSSIFPSVTKGVIAESSMCQKSESLVEVDEKMEEVNNEIEKNSDDSSPSPSDSSNNVDEFSCSANDLAEKPFTCEHANCHKRFANKFLLKKHQFIHTGLRPHCCPFCGKRFNRKDNLLRHKKTHLANALGTEVTNALSSEELLMQLSVEKPILKLENDPDDEEEL